MDELKEIKYMLTVLEVDLKKFYDKSNKAASIRARKVLQQIKDKCQDIRMDISKQRNERGL